MEVKNQKYLTQITSTQRSLDLKARKSAVHLSVRTVMLASPRNTQGQECCAFGDGEVKEDKEIVIMAKKNEIIVRDVSIKTIKNNGEDYLCITDIARQKNSAEPKDVVKNWMRQKNTLEYLGLWERLHNPNFKGVEFDPLLTEAGSNSFTMSPTRWISTRGQGCCALECCVLTTTRFLWSATP